MNPTELRALQTPIIVLLLVVGVGAGLIYQLDQILTSTKREFAQQQNQMREARTRLQKSGDEKELIVRYLPNYDYLQRIGFVGDEQRLNWLEGLRLSNQQTQLFGIQYQIGSQQAYAYADELEVGQLTLHQSVMKLDFQLLHESDLMRFLTTLGKQGAGFFAVNQCRIQRVGSGGSIRVQPNLRATCDISWITLRPNPPGDKKP
jgi:hypothetical protein